MASTGGVLRLKRSYKINTALVARLLADSGKTPKQFSRDTGISAGTLKNWLDGGEGLYSRVLNFAKGTGKKPQDIAEDFPGSESELPPAPKSVSGLRVTWAEAPPPTADTIHEIALLDRKLCELAGNPSEIEFNDALDGSLEVELIGPADELAKIVAAFVEGRFKDFGVTNCEILTQGTLYEPISETEGESQGEEIQSPAVAAGNTQRAWVPPPGWVPPNLSSDLPDWIIHWVPEPGWIPPAGWMPPHGWIPPPGFVFPTPPNKWGRLKSLLQRIRKWILRA